MVAHFMHFSHSILFLLLLLPTLLSGQLIPTEETMDNWVEEAEWSRHYAGAISGDQLITISLVKNVASDEVVGRLFYIKSNFSLPLKGKLIGDEISLDETGPTGALSGSIKAYLNENGINGEWRNFNNRIGGSLKLKKVSTEQEARNLHLEGHQVYFYEGRYGNFPIKMFLFEDKHGRTLGNLFLSSQNKTYELSGTSVSGKVKISLKTEDHTEEGTIHGSIDENGLLTAQMEVKGVNHSISLSPKKTIPLTRYTFADYSSSISIVYPKFGLSPIDNYIASNFKAWQEELTGYLHDQKKPSIELTPEQRASNRAYNWFDIDYLTDRLASIHFTSGTTWEDEFTDFSVNFDLQSGKPIFKEDLFTNIDSMERFLAHYIPTELAKLAFNEDPFYGKFIKDLAFDQISLKKEGVSFRSGFNSLYGEQSVTVPYKSLLYFVGSSSPIAHLVLMK